MKKLFLAFVILANVLCADSSYELHLYEKVLPSLFMQTPIRVYADKESRALLSHSVKFELVHDCSKDVVLLVGKNFSELADECKTKPLFATSYKEYKNAPNSIGAFYWRKGRPQLHFKSDMMEKYRLIVPIFLQRYVK